MFGKSGQKLIIKISIFLLGAVALIKGLSMVGHYFDPDPAYESRKSVIEELLAESDKVEALAVGNSHSTAIDFEALGYEGFHIWHGWGDMFEVRHQLEALIPRLPNVKVIFISVSYFSFDWDTSAVQRTTRIRQRTYATTPSVQLIDWDVENYIMGKLLFGFVRPDHWEAALLAPAPNGDAGVDPSLIEDLSPRAEISATKSGDKLVAHAKFRVDEQLVLQTEMVKARPDINNDTYRAVISMVNFLKRHDIRVVFYTPPYFELYTDLYDVETVNRMKQNMEQLQRDYGVEYYDFSTNKEFITNDTVFKNSDHLNDYGSRLFSSRLKGVMIEHERKVVQGLSK